MVGGGLLKFRLFRGGPVFSSPDRGDLDFLDRSRAEMRNPPHPSCR